LTASRRRKVEPARGADEKSLFNISPARRTCPFTLVRHQPYDAENDIDKRPQKDDEAYTDCCADCLTGSARIGEFIGRATIGRRIGASHYPDNEQNLHREDDPGERAP
jgi:hypothetical protein